jgi:hypothetical protein
MKNQNFGGFGSVTPSPLFYLKKLRLILGLKVIKGGP